MQSSNVVVVAKTFAIILICANGLVVGENLSCYQCSKNTNVECSEDELLPCASTYDRCVTHIMKDATTGFTIKRECGLGPCVFNDVMMDKGLGFDNCDRSSDEYFCISCCKGNGCNKSHSSANVPTIMLIFVAIVAVVLNVVKNFQPPYLPESM